MEKNNKDEYETAYFEAILNSIRAILETMPNDKAIKILEDLTRLFNSKHVVGK